MNKLEKTAYRVLSALIPFRELRKNFREKFIRKSHSSITQTHSIYGKIYTPIYNLSCELNNKEPEIYNKFGQKMETFFIRDMHSAHSPCGASNYFIWDRYNFGLDTHFYTHKAMLETMGSPKRRYGLLVESEGIVPEDYKIFDKHKGLNKDFDLIFTHSEQILEICDNARFHPACAAVWYGVIPSCGGILSNQAFSHKTKNISMVSSNKSMCELHDFRINLARKLKQKNIADTYGTFDGGAAMRISESLTDYRYSVAVENIISPYFFTEKITNCFAAMTIPIYLGATKIDQFFNADGIIQIIPKDFDNIENILKQCSRDDYEQRLPAILDNYNRVQKYLNLGDKLYEEYLKK